MLRQLVLGSGLALAAAAVTTAPAVAQEYKARLDGFFEVGALPSLTPGSPPGNQPTLNAPTGAILTKGTGKLRLIVDRNSASYSLIYSGLTSDVLQAHLHFGKVHVPGGIYAFLCTNLNNGPAGTPACPAAGGTVTGTLTAASIRPVPTQNITAGDFGALLSALASDTTYVNVHTKNFPSGEIRGQTQQRENDDDEDDRQGRDR
jgi:hypothetical protein